MQYLSKAYNYYSGINPATLSGAIDVIVVRSTDENGEDVLACSPFHVRFGKLRVLRATDKRVTVSLPNNLPEPHIAPFSMKVGETGEAFFVLETEDEVPLDLMTSPVITATDAEEPSRPSIEEQPPEDMTSSLTMQPFGGTEQQVTHKGHNDHTGKHLPEVEPLDLNASENDPLGSAALGDKLTSDKASDKASFASLSPQTSRKRRSSAGMASNQPSNPLTAKPGETTDLPIRNYRLSNVHTDEKGFDLPKVRPGEHEGPEVKYGTDIVLDMDGFHENEKSGAKSSSSNDPVPATPEMRPSASMPASPPRAKSPMLIRNPQLDSFVEDLMGSHGSNDLPAALESLSLENGTPRKSPASKLRRGDRVQSEPPEDSRPASPNGDKVASSQMDYAWDWGKVPGEEEEGQRPQHRAGSLPPGDESGVAAKRASLRQAAANEPHVFLLELDGRVHLFELSLCGGNDYAPECNASDEELDAFDRERITFKRFMEDPSIVDDPRLVIYYDGLHMTWTTGYPLLLSLAIYRRSLPSEAESPTKDTAAPQSGYGWSRWWRRSEAPTPSMPAVSPVAATAGLQSVPLEKTHSSPEVPTKKDLKKEEDEKKEDQKEKPEPTRGSSMPVVPAPAPAAGESAIAESEASADEKHYAKTLRLSSDQLKELNLKPGPNTVQFSVTSSYSGLAVVTARIFLWDEHDQVIISDIDGTITKSDALGHVFAAIGRDWTHVGIANLYTDICNNGYKILYLTARAIGQADTTREYLKTIVQGEYRMPEGPVIMSPDRLMASLHREVILRKPELFKMACLRDIQRLFAGHAKDAFFAGFGNRITDAMSYRSVGIPTGKIYTIDSTGVLKTELLQSSHRGSYVGLNDLVNEMFPPVKTKVQPEFTDFNFWRDPIMDIPIPDFTPPSPALSARSDASGNSRLSYLGGLLGRRGSRAASPEATSQPGSPRPSSPLIGPAVAASDLDSDDEHQWVPKRQNSDSSSRQASMPGSFDDGAAFPAEWLKRGDSKAEFAKEPREIDEGSDEEYDEDDDAIFDDDILATGEMARVPF